MGDVLMKEKDKDRQKQEFWHQRAAHYDKLFWTKDEEYLDVILAAGNFRKDDVVLDVGVGTGAIAKKIQPYVKQVVGLDISDSMLKKGSWEGISIVNWDICDALFTNAVFDKIVARMVFHHILDNLDIAIKRCYDMLRKGGKIIVAEGVPPSDESYVIDWYTNMFKLKEERLTFTPQELVDRLKRCGFKRVVAREHIMRDFSIESWLTNSGLELEKRDKIMELHLSADERIKNSYNMRITNGDCLCDTKNVVVVGLKE
jgi:ubiquinone/menaquinone biosynthesis C-methylase UbiE